MIDHDLKEIMETESGRRFIYRLLQSSSVDNAALVIDPYAGAYYQGKRAVGAELLNAIRELPDGWDLELLMRKEARAQPQKEDKDFYKQFY